MRPRTLLALAFTISSLALPLLAHAGGIPFFGPIIPATFNGVATNQCAAGWGLLMTVINNVISLLITLVIVFVAPLMIAYAGFLFVVNPVNASGKEQAKKILTHTVVGIVIALCGWLIVDAVMAVLYKSPSGTWGTWSSLISGGGDTCIPLAASLAPAAPPVPGVAVVPGAADEQSIRARLAAAGVTINHDPCPAVTDGKGCTNVSNMKEATIQQLINIANACGGIRCGVVVSGGTEPGHATTGTYTHANGYKVDLSLNPSVPNVDVLDAYLLSLKSIGTRTGDGPGPAYTDSCGQNQYVREGTSATPHWDITVTAACGAGVAGQPAGRRVNTGTPDCPVVDITEKSTFSSLHDPMRTASPGETISYRLQRSLIQADNLASLGRVEPYEMVVGTTMQVSDQPCFVNPVPSWPLECQRTNVDRFEPNVQFAGPNSGYTDAQIATDGSCRLPLPDSNDYYYINIQSPAVCDNDACKYFFYYGITNTTGPVASQVSTNTTPTTPANCVIKDITSGFGHPAGDYATAYAYQPATETWAYRITFDQLFSPTRQAAGPSALFSYIFTYDSYAAVYSLSLTSNPCEFHNTAPVGFCQTKGISGSGYGEIDLRYRASTAAGDTSYCVLPAPAGQINGVDFWYVNLRHAMGPNVEVPYTNTCTASQCGRYLLRDL